MSINTSHTTYVPGKPLDKQLERIAPPTVAQVDMSGMIMNAPPYKVQRVDFKPLKINDCLFNLSLDSHSAVGRDEQGMYVYDKYAFTIKNADGTVLHSEVSTADIEEKVTQIYESTKK